MKAVDVTAVLEMIERRIRLTQAGLDAGINSYHEEISYRQGHLHEARAIRDEIKRMIGKVEK
jgi:hypothetical protein